MICNELLTLALLVRHKKQDRRQLLAHHHLRLQLPRPMMTIALIVMTVWVVSVQTVAMQAMNQRFLEDSAKSSI